MFLFKMGGFALILALTSIFFPSSLAAEEKRVEKLDMYVIIDGSAALKNTWQQVLTWFSEQIVDKILQDGDRVSVWIAANRPEPLFSQTLSGAESKKNLRSKLLAAKAPAGTADFNETFQVVLREMMVQEGSAQGSLPPYIILITGTAGGFSPGPEGSAGNLFRYSRAENFSGWRVFRAAGNIAGQVRDAAAAYLRATD